MHILSSESIFNAIYILQSLEQGEIETGRLLSENVLSLLCAKHSKIHRFYNVPNKKAFIEILQEILARCGQSSEPEYPILHLEIHGLDDKSGLIFYPSNEVLLWDDFADICRQINLECKNNLIVVLAVCHGFFSITQAKPLTEVTPFYALIGSEQDLTAGWIEKKFAEFYKQLLKSYDLSSAQQLLTPECKLFICEKLFLDGFIKYIEDKCTGNGRKHRAEQLLTTAKEKYPGKTLSTMRKRIKKAIAPSSMKNRRKFTECKEKYLLSNIPENADRFNITFDDVLGLYKKT